MTLHSLFPEENPFTHLKARQIFLFYFLVSIVLIVLVYSLIYSFLYYLSYIFFDIDYHDYQRIVQDPIIPSLILLLMQGLVTTWVVRKLKLIQIQPKAIIGRLPIHFNWLPIIGIVLTRKVFSFGVVLVLYYPLSLFSLHGLRIISVITPLTLQDLNPSLRFLPIYLMWLPHLHVLLLRCLF
jgi:hypothetical protein